MSLPNMRMSGIFSYSKKLFDHKNYGFGFFENGDSTILSTSFGVQLNFLLDSLLNYPVDRICISLKKQQDSKTGLFIDDNFDIKQTVGFEEEYIFWQFTYFATIVLDMLGEKPQYSFNFLTDLKIRKSLEKWLKNQDYRNFWHSSNKIMFLFYFLTYEQERENLGNSEIINCLFDLLDSKQNAYSGFWGTQNGTSLENGMCGSSHIYLFYDFHGREISYKDKIVDNVIKLQNSYGLFGSKFGGACEDYDAIEILSIVLKHTDYKKDVVRKIAYKTYDVIWKSQNKDGGFSCSIDNRSILEKLKDKIDHKDYYYEYSGWNKMRSNRFKSDLWGTYFRVLTIAKIEKMLGIDSNNKYKFYSLPGWGYK